MINYKNSAIGKWINIGYSVGACFAIITLVISLLVIRKKNSNEQNDCEDKTTEKEMPNSSV